MGKTSISNVPYFFKGTYAQLIQALSPGGMFYPLDKAAYGFVTDRSCMFYCDIDGNLKLVGDTSTSVEPEKGTEEKPVILNQLPAGVYSISGAYKTSEDEPLVETSANQLFIVGNDGTITQMTGEAMTKTVVSETGAIVEESYVTDAEIIRSVASKEDIDSLFS